MKKLAILLGLAFLVITGVIVHLVRSGISLRSAPLIRPSVITRNGWNIAEGVALRLSPELHDSHYLIWGVLPVSPDSELILKMIREEFEKLQGAQVTILKNAQESTPEQIRSCPAPCWLLVPKEQAHEMEPNPFIQSKIRPLKVPYSTVSFLEFSRISQVPDRCLEQKRLTYDCLKILAVHEAQRKMNDASQRYFFMRRYLDHDFFLFVQDAPFH